MIFTTMEKNNYKKMFKYSFISKIKEYLCAPFEKTNRIINILEV